MFICVPVPWSTIRLVTAKNTSSRQTTATIQVPLGNSILIIKPPLVTEPLDLTIVQLPAATSEQEELQVPAPTLCCWKLQEPSILFTMLIWQVGTTPPLPHLPACVSITRAAT